MTESQTFARLEARYHLLRNETGSGARAARGSRSRRIQDLQVGGLRATEMTDRTFVILQLAMICEGMKPGTEKTVLTVASENSPYPYGVGGEYWLLVRRAFNGSFLILPDSVPFGNAHSDDPVEFATDVVDLYELESVELVDD